MSFTLLGILNAQAVGGAVGGAAFDLLETTILTTNQSSVEFTGLGDYSDYKHLQIRLVGRSTRVNTQDAYALTFNGDTGTNYTTHTLRGDGSAVASFARTSDPFILLNKTTAASSPANEFSGSVIDILDFSNSSKNTTIRAFLGATSSGQFVALHSGAYYNTDAVTSINLDLQIGPNYLTGSRFSLYGIKAA